MNEQMYQVNFCVEDIQDLSLLVRIRVYILNVVVFYPVKNVDFHLIKDFGSAKGHYKIHD